MESSCWRTAKLHSTGQAGFRVGLKDGRTAHGAPAKCGISHLYLPIINVFKRRRVFKIQNCKSCFPYTLCHISYAIYAFFFALCILPLPAADAAQLTLGWNRCTEPDIAGYRIHYGASSGHYEFSVDVGNYDSCTISDLIEGQTYYFAATSYNLDNIESIKSEELVYTIPLTDITGGVDKNSGEMVIEAEDMNYHSNGKQIGTEWLLWANGNMNEEVDFPDTANYHFEITARGDLAQGVGPEMHLIIDGESQGSYLVNTDTAQTFVFDIPVSAGVHDLAIGFSNDLYNPAKGYDRNLFVDNITILFYSDGVVPEVPPVSETPPVSDATQKVIEIEAENGSFNYPFEYAWDREASSDGFVWVPNGRRNARIPSQNSGYIELSFQAPTPGVYFVWCRVLARNKRDNSFFVSIDNSGYALWEVETSKSWIWDQVSDRGGADPASIYIGAGAHILFIWHREDGTKLDKVVITDDPSYIPHDEAR